MPAPYKPTDDIDVEADPVLLAREKAAMREGMAVAAKSAAGWVPIAGAVLILGYYLARSTFKAADHIFEDAGTEWDQAMWPSAMFGIFGLAYGALIGWRISTTSGLVGGPAWKIGAAAVIAVAVIGVIGALFIHTEKLPILIWLSSGVMLIGAMGSITFFSKWNP